MAETPVDRRRAVAHAVSLRARDTNDEYKGTSAP